MDELNRTAGAGLPDPVALAVPAFVVLIIIEVLYVRLTRQGAYNTADAATSLAMGLGSVLIGLITKAALLAFFVWAFQFRLFDIPYAWWSFVLCFFLEDLAYYWFHRIAHERRVWWASHVVHHSSQHYNLTTALRQTWTGTFDGSWLPWLALVMIGFPPAMVFLMKGISLVYQFWVHTEAVRKLGPLEWVLNTPSHHRVHHATNPRYLDANYAGVLIIWDRLFGTFVPEVDTDPPRYGLVSDIGTFNPVRVAFHEVHAIIRDLRHARTWAERWGYVFGPPGWSPDGSRTTSAKLKAEWRAKLREVSPPP
jgi:sterol desaturase/sphingolipid hydroxylase (fatty acid hydroxylase superfamily)